MTALLFASPAWAQQRVVTSVDLRTAMAEKAARDAERRELVVSVLRDEEVRQLAARLSLDLTRAERAVATLSDEDLAAAAETARVMQQDLAGEGHTVTISITTLLLIIIIIILLAD
jgi:RecG-like helicase